MVYRIDQVIHGHFTVDVEADTLEEAKVKAEQEYSNADFGALREIEADLYWYEDDDSEDRQFFH